MIDRADTNDYHIAPMKEWLMGWHICATELRPLATAKFLLGRRQHG